MIILIIEIFKKLHKISMKSKKSMLKVPSKPKKSYTRVPSGEKRVLLDTKSSMFKNDHKLNISNTQAIIHDKAKGKLVISPSNLRMGKASNMTSAERTMMNFTQMPVYFNTKKSKSRKRNLNNKNTYSDK